MALRAVLLASVCLVGLLCFELSTLPTLKRVTALRFGQAAQALA